MQARWVIGTAFAVALVGAAAALAPERVTVEFRAASMEPAAGLTEMRIEGGSAYYVAKEVILDNDDVVDARAELDSLTGQAVIRIVFTDEGTKVFAAHTQAHVNQPLAILVDGTLVSAPVVREPILAGTAIINGFFTMEEATQIASGIVPPRVSPTRPE
jgi:preprotein translocase subunit SecD